SSHMTSKKCLIVNLKVVPSARLLLSALTSACLSPFRQVRKSDQVRAPRGSRANPTNGNMNGNTVPNGVLGALGTATLDPEKQLSLFANAIDAQTAKALPFNAFADSAPYFANNGFQSNLFGFNSILMHNLMATYPDIFNYFMGSQIDFKTFKN